MLEMWACLTWQICAYLEKTEEAALDETHVVDV